MEKKNFQVVIANEKDYYTNEKYNTVLTGFTSDEEASKSAFQTLRDIAGEMGKGSKVFFSETLGVWVLYNSNTGSWLLTAKIEEIEETHAARCLDIYVNNDFEIYTKLTEPAIKAAAMGNKKIMEVYVINALKNAADLVRINDGLKPTQKDIERVKSNYVAYIIECAEYQTKTA